MTNEAKARLFLSKAYSQEFIDKIMRVEEEPHKKGFTRVRFILYSGNALSVFVNGDTIRLSTRFYRKNRLTKNGKWEGTVLELMG